MQCELMVTRYIVKDTWGSGYVTTGNSAQTLRWPPREAGANACQQAVAGSRRHPAPAPVAHGAVEVGHQQQRLADPVAALALSTKALRMM